MTSLDPRLVRSPEPVCKAWDIANVRFARPDLPRAGRFLQDFGLRDGGAGGDALAYGAAGGYGPCYLVRAAEGPAFVGFSLAVSDRQDLDRLAALPGAFPIEPADDWPEGLQVRLKDPAGNAVHAVFGPRTDPQADRSRLVQNSTEAFDRLNRMQRPPSGPSHIQRLGHIVLNVVDFFACARWYLDTFGLIASDVQTLPNGEAALAFMRCDRGDTPADHHTLVLVQNVINGFGHCAFECIDVDDIAMGQEHLHAQGYTHAWGIGRHLLGSQMFDYWRDPWGDKFEHFVDSDLFTADRPTDVSPLTSGGLYQWGPALPKDFEAPKMSFGFLWTAISNVRRSKEMNFRRMGALMKAVQEPARPWIKP